MNLVAVKQRIGRMVGDRRRTSRHDGGAAAVCVLSGERSSRRIERRCQRDVAFRVITANQGPITPRSPVPADHEPTGHALHTGAAALCRGGPGEGGDRGVGRHEDPSHAALASNRTVETITAEVSRMLTEAQATDTAEDRQYGSERCGDELPEALRDRTSRLTRLRACQERLEREAADATASSRPRSRRGGRRRPLPGRRSGAANRRRPRRPRTAPPRRM